jgi:hypothetical protein
MKPRKDTLTQEELKQILSYSYLDGKFTWLVKPSKRICAGATAGSISRSGYSEIRIKRKLYYAHRLAWLYMTGDWPKDHIDHINGIKDDNRFCNLREATNQQNQFNRSVKGYSFLKPYNKYWSQICVGGKRISLGYFTTEQEARNTYLKAKIKYHGTEFSERVNG